MAKDLAKWANEKGVKYFMVSFTDLAGAQRAKLVVNSARSSLSGVSSALMALSSFLAER